jgi:uncharacterized RDD family membrane protein YckC
MDVEGIRRRNLNDRVPAGVRPFIEDGERALVVIGGAFGAIVATDRRVIVERTMTPMAPEIHSYRSLTGAIGHLGIFSRRSVALQGPGLNNDPGIGDLALSRNATVVQMWNLSRARESVAELNALIPAMGAASDPVLSASEGLQRNVAERRSARSGPGPHGSAAMPVSSRRTGNLATGRALRNRMASLRRAQGDGPRMLAAAESGRRVAGIGLRVGAYLVDLLLLVVVSIAGWSVVGAAHRPGLGQIGPILLGVFGIYQVGLWSIRGGTMGMLLGGLRVESAKTGRNLSLRQAIVRWLPLGLPFFAGVESALIVLLVLLVTAATNVNRQGFHDQLANSIVVVPVRVVDGIDVPVRDGTLVWVILGTCLGLRFLAGGLDSPN